VPPYGGDTQWANLAAAFDALSPAMQQFLEGLRGVHSFGRPVPGGETEYDERIKDNHYTSEHPLVRVHPETGEKSLYISPSFLKYIVGLSAQESQHILEMLWEHAVRPEFTVRFRWQPGSVAFWDNRTTCHLAPRDIFDTDFDRQFYRVTLLGDVPVGPDGEASVAMDGGLIEALA
jgi:taurine dioxygenase